MLKTAAATRQRAQFLPEFNVADDVVELEGFYTTSIPNDRAVMKDKNSTSDTATMKSASDEVCYEQYLVNYQTRKIVSQLESPRLVSGMR